MQEVFFCKEKTEVCRYRLQMLDKDDYPYRVMEVQMFFSNFSQMKDMFGS